MGTLFDTNVWPRACPLQSYFISVSIFVVYRGPSMFALQNIALVSVMRVLFCLFVVLDCSVAMKNYATKCRKCPENVRPQIYGALFGLDILNTPKSGSGDGQLAHGHVYCACMQCDALKMYRCLHRCYRLLKSGSLLFPCLLLV